EGRSFSYANLATEADSLKDANSGQVVLKPAGQLSVLGASVPKIGGRDIVTGAHRYPSDIVRPGMLYGKVLRAPAYNSELVNIDLDAARARNGVVVVRDGGFVGVAAKNSYLAGKAIEALAKTAEWKREPHPGSEELFEHLTKHAREGRASQRGEEEPSE